MPKTMKSGYCLLKTVNGYYGYIFLIFRKVIFKQAELILAGQKKLASF
jgi:hypothetical protein